MKYTYLLLILIISLFTGCDDTEIKNKNTQLLLKINTIKSYNLQLEVNLEEAIINNKKNEKELSRLRDNNQGLNVTLAKSELLFSKKNKEEIEIANRKLIEDREKIENKAYENAKSSVKTQYFGAILVLIILLITALAGWFFSRKKYEKELLLSNGNIEDLKNKNTSLENEKSELKENLSSFSHTIEELKRREKEGSKNEVVNTIELTKLERASAMNSIKGIK